MERLVPAGEATRLLVVSGGSTVQAATADAQQTADRIRSGLAGFIDTQMSAGGFSNVFGDQLAWLLRV